MKSEAQQLVHVQTTNARLEGNLDIPDGASGIVVFAHGSGSSRHSSRNRYVAGELNDARMATLLFDLLTPEEEEIDRFTRELRFDIPMLAERVKETVDWLHNRPETKDLSVGLFGASTGAAAALIAAADRAERVNAVVSRGGRPDLAKEALSRVKSPSLFIVGGLDHQVIQLNEIAFNQLEIDEAKIEIVPGATHLFEEPGKLEEVAKLAKDWFAKYL